MERLKVRPFERLTKAPEETQTHLVAGIIRGGSFWLQLDRLQFELITEETGSDDLGPFALVEESDTALPGGYLLRVEAEQEERLGDISTPPGCWVGLAWTDPPFKNELPPGMKFLRHVRSSLEVHFSSLGQVGSVSFLPPQRGQAPEGE